MNGVEVLSASFKFHHQMANTVIGDCTPEMLKRRVEGGNIGTAGATIVHAIFAEDMFVQTILKGEATLAHSGAWAQKTGVNFPEAPRQTDEWVESVALDVAKFMPYVMAVFASSEAYIDSLKDADLDREVEFFGRPQPLGQFLGTLGLYHLTEHMGEVAALKGVMGLKGLPF